MRSPKNKPEKSDAKERHFLFELGKALILTQAIADVPVDSFRNSMKLTTLALLDDVNMLSGIEEVYKEALV